MLIFTPPVAPSIQSNRKSSYRVLQADFGDGYQQRAADGLNTKRQSLSLFWASLDEAQAGEIVSFLDQCRGVTAFEWQPPAINHSSKWICDGYTESSIEAGLCDLSAEFREVFDL